MLAPSAHAAPARCTADVIETALTGAGQAEDRQTGPGFYR